MSAATIPARGSSARFRPSTPSSPARTRPDTVDLLGVQRVAQPALDDHVQLVFRANGEPEVDTVAMSGGCVDEAVALEVGVVDDDGEHGHTT